MISFISDVIGTPYCMQNEHGLNCWGVVAKYYGKTGNVLKNYVISSLSSREITTVFSLAFYNNDHGFIKTDTPKNGDVVIFKSHIQYHCGLWFDGKILHSSHHMNGVTYQRIEDIRGFREIEFWTYDKD